MTNLLELSRDSFGDDTADLVARAIEAPREGTRLAIDAILPAIVGAVAQRSADLAGAERILRMLRSASIERVGPSAGAARLLSGPGATERLIGSGPGIVGALFEDRARSLAGSLGVIGGIDAAAASRLLEIVAPLALGVFKNFLVESRVDGAGFSAIAAAQRESLQGAIDRRLLGALGFPSIAAYLDATSAANTGARASAPPERLRRLRPWLYLALALLVFAALVLFMP